MLPAVRSRRPWLWRFDLSLLMPEAAMGQASGPGMERRPQALGLQIRPIDAERQP
jgi:hypothetical protein